MANLAIRGGTFAAVDRSPNDVAVVDGLIGTAPAPACPTLDASGCTVVPGFIDLQLNGGWGVDFTSEPQRMHEVACRLPATGVTSFLPTVITSSPTTTSRAIAALSDAAGRRRPSEARSLGIHLEGPYLNPLRKGAHPPQHLRMPSLEEAGCWGRESGVALVTLAPELPGAVELIAALRRNGVVVSAGHTAADAAELRAAVAAGVRAATHLFNAMGPFGGREPNTVGPLLADRAITIGLDVAGPIVCGLIVDGIHVDPVMVDVAWRARGPHGIALVTDAITALGAGFGRFGIGDTVIIVDETGARTSTGILAGSVLRMDEALRNLIAYTGCTLADAVTAASATPASLLGRVDLGSLDTGSVADIVLLDERLEVVATVIGGVVAYDPQGRLTPA